MAGEEGDTALKGKVRPPAVEAGSTRRERAERAGVPALLCPLPQSPGDKFQCLWAPQSGHRQHGHPFPDTGKQSGGGAEVGVSLTRMAQCSPGPMLRICPQGRALLVSWACLVWELKAAFRWEVLAGRRSQRVQTRWLPAWYGSRWSLGTQAHCPHGHGSGLPLRTAQLAWAR